MMPRHDDPHEQLLPRLRAWRRHNVHIGVSPRVSPVWDGLLYREPHGTCAEYAQFFDTAAVRFGPWCFPDTAALVRMNRQAGEDFGWTAVIENEQMVYRFPYGYPDRRKRGAVNPHFLDPRRMRENVFPLLSLLEPSLHVVVLKIGQVYRTERFGFDDFQRALVRCLDALPPVYRYAVENHTPGFVLPEYLMCLHERNVIYIPASTPLLDAIRMPGVLTADACVVRSACVVMEEEGEEWTGFREAARLCLEEGKALYAYLGDGSEEGEGTAAGALRGAGSARLTRLLAGLDPDLARRSPIKRKAA